MHPPANDGARLRFSLTRVDDPHRLAVLWQSLDRRAGPEPFLTWPWVEAWLRLIDGRQPVDLFTARTADDTVMAAALVVSRRHRPDPLPLRRSWLFETGHTVIDAITVEGNGLHMPADATPDQLAACAAGLLSVLPAPDEVIVRRGQPAQIAAFEQQARQRGYQPRVISQTSRLIHRIDPATAEGGVEALLAGFSVNSRAAIRRALRLYQDQGAVQAETAPDAAVARVWFDRLISLHQASWQARGQPGAFAVPGFAEFHAGLIDRWYGDGFVLVQRIAAGDQEIGYLYHLQRQATVFNYQSGFVATGDDNRLKPGLVSHVLAIAEAARTGAVAYDFLAGDARYKRSLANEAVPVAGVALAGPTPLGRLEAIWRRARTALTRPQPEPPPESD